MARKSERERARAAGQIHGAIVCARANSSSERLRNLHAMSDGVTAEDFGGLSEAITDEIVVMIVARIAGHSHLFALSDQDTTRAMIFAGAIDME